MVSIKNIFFKCLFLVLTLLTLRVHAQINSADTIIKSSTIDIIQIYQPKVQQVEKQSYSPDLPPLNTALPHYEYNAPIQVKEYGFRAQPLQALAYSLDTSKKSYNNYVKLGLGNLQTVYADAGFHNDLKAPIHYNTHFGFSHQKGNLPFQKHWAGVFSSALIFNETKQDIQLAFNAASYHFNQYGFDTAVFSGKKAAKQVLNGASIILSINDRGFNIQGFKLVSKLEPYLYSNPNRINETGVNVLLGTQKQAANHTILQLTAIAQCNQTKLTPDPLFISPLGHSMFNYVLGLNMGATYEKEQLKIKAHLQPSLGQFEKFYLLHDIELGIWAKSKKSYWSIGAQAQLNQNWYSKLYQNNPFIQNYYSLQGFQQELFAQAKLAIAQHWSLNVKGSWVRYKNLASFVNQNYETEKIDVFYIPQTDAMVLNMHLRYQIATRFSVGAHLLFNNYFNTLGSRSVWQLPTSQMQFDLQWQPYSKLFFTAYAKYWGSMSALDSLSTVVKSKAFVDLGFAAEYQATQPISFFIQFDNLLNRHYQRWMYYPSYGINIYGGIRFKF